MNIHSSGLPRVRHCERTCKFMQLRALKTSIMQSCRLDIYVISMEFLALNRRRLSR